MRIYLSGRDEMLEVTLSQMLPSRSFSSPRDGAISSMHLDQSMTSSPPDRQPHSRARIPCLISARLITTTPIACQTHGILYSIDTNLSQAMIYVQRRAGTKSVPRVSTPVSRSAFTQGSASMCRWHAFGNIYF